MHPNEARPHPLPPLRATAWGTRTGQDARRYHDDVIAALGWADKEWGIDTMFVEETIDRYPYCVNGQMWTRVSPGVWLRREGIGDASSVGSRTENGENQ